jgi:hypothetical protein
MCNLYGITSSILQKIDRPMLAPCTVFNQAHDQAIAFLGLNDNNWDFCLTELNEGLDSTLATYKIIAHQVFLALSWAHRDGTLQPDVSDALHDFLKVTAIAQPRI